MCHVPTSYEATFSLFISPKYTAHSLPVKGPEAFTAANHKIVLTVFTQTMQMSCPGIVKALLLQGGSMIQALLALAHLHKHSLHKRDCCRESATFMDFNHALTTLSGVEGFEFASFWSILSQTKSNRIE